MKTHPLALRTLVAVTALAAALTAGAGSRQAAVSGSHTYGNLRASAALQPVGAVTGWGQVAVSDKQNGHGLTRRAEILLFGLEPDTEYAVTVDGVDLYTLLTDSAGDAAVRLGDNGGAEAPVPSGIPSAADLTTATVTDPSLAAVLEGAFVTQGAGGGPASPSIYEERIDLTDVTGGTAEGVAKVERHADDKQEFGTWATGLMPEESYSVVVDGFTAGVVTTDASGQGSLELETPSTDNPLPPEMQPIEDLRLVEWADSAGETILSGSFTGVSDQGDGEDDGTTSLSGIITGFTADGFLLQLGAREIQVVLTADTTFDGVASADELALGDRVEVEGPFDGHVITADSVSLDDGSGDGEEDFVHFKGVITAMTADGFLFQHGAKELAVVATADTTFDGVDGLADLVPGDAVEVEGMMSGDTITASSIALEEGGDGNGNAEVSWKGLVTALTDTGFFLQHGAKDIQVVVGADTELDGIASLDELVVGDKAEVEGTFDGKILTAAKVNVKSNGGD